MMVDRYRMPDKEVIATAVEELMDKEKVCRIIIDFNGSVVFLEQDKEPTEEERQKFVYLPEDLAREHETEEVQPILTPLHTLHVITEQIRRDGLYPTHVLVGDRARFFRWLGLDTAQFLLGLEVRETADYPTNVVVLTASNSAMDPIMGIVKSFCVRMENG